jgi:hypothetical protein
MLSVPQSPNHYHTILILVQLQPSGESFSGHSELFSIFYSPLQQRLDSECGRSLIVPDAAQAESFQYIGEVPLLKEGYWVS